MGVRTIGIRTMGLQNPVSGSSSAAPVVLPTLLTAQIIEPVDATDFVITGKTITEVIITEDTVLLTVSEDFVYGDVVTVGYTGGITKLTGVGGGEVADFTDQPVTNTIVAPAGDLIEITTTLTGDFSIILAGTGDVVITWPDLSIGRKWRCCNYKSTYRRRRYNCQ
jgi:hypothetical protein